MRHVEDQRRPGSDDLFELLSALAHDLRAPMTPIKGYAEIIRTRPALGPDRTVQYAEIIAEAAARMENSLDLLSGISALYGGRADITTEVLRPADVVAQRLDLWRSRQAGRVFAGSDAGTGRVVHADRGWLGRALDVMIDQAVHAWPAPATIAVGAAAAADGRGTVFRVGGEGADPPTVSHPDRLGTAFLQAVSDVCGYRLVGTGEMHVPSD